MKYALRTFDRLDTILAAACGTGSFLVYGRTMAPDILYGDSAELQTLVYTLGHTHSTGYPIYLLLARLVGFLPLNSPAWRVTLFSVLMASLAVAGTYLLCRMLTNSKAGAALATIALALSYTLWSQAVITEVYAAGAAFLVWILLLTLHWQQDPDKRGKSLFAAALLSGLSLGVHATTALSVLPAAGFVAAWLVSQRAAGKGWRRGLLTGGVGTLIGVGLWLAAFLYIDWHNPPSSFINVMLYPSRSIWGLAPEDMDSALKRIVLTLNSVQWNDVLFAGGSEAANESLGNYLSGITDREFSIWFLLFGLTGWWVLFSRSILHGSFLLASYGLCLYFVLNYHPSDQYVFFLSTYPALAAVAGVGFGALIEAPARWRIVSRRGWAPAVSAILALLLTLAVVTPHLPERMPALKTGVASFVEEDYQFPVKNLREPRLLAQMHLSPLPDDAAVLMEWRDLYALGYLAYVEGQKPGILLAEAMPRGNDGKVSDSIVETIHQWLADGRPVYAAQRFPGLEERFHLTLGPNRYVKIIEKDR
jgi:hypothetical protein